MLRYENASQLLADEFPEMKAILEDEPELADTPYIFYDFEGFIPYIMKQLQEKNRLELKKIFDFVELLFTEGDSCIVNLADVAVVESLYNQDDFDYYRDTIFALCGKRTRQSFFDSMDYYEQDKAI